MDFGTILKKLDGNLYTSGHEFESDSKLVFKNCYTFNTPGSEVYEMGRKLEQVFDLKWRERPVVGPSSKKSGLAGGADDSDESSSEEEQDLNKMQENLLKLMQEVTKLAAHKGSKKKEKHKKHKMHALLQQQALVASMAGAAAASSSSISSSAPSKKKKKSSSSSHSRPKAPAAASVREITYQQKKELSEKIEDLSPDKLEGVYQIIRSGLPSLDTQAAGQEEIELDIDSLDRVTLSRLYHFVINAARPTSAPPAQPKSLSHTAATNGASSSESDDSSGSDSDSGSSSSSSSGSNDGESSGSSFGGGELVSPEVIPTASAGVPVPLASSSSSSAATSKIVATLPPPVIPIPIPVCFGVSSKNFLTFMVCKFLVAPKVQPVIAAAPAAPRFVFGTICRIVADMIIKSSGKPIHQRRWLLLLVLLFEDRLHCTLTLLSPRSSKCCMMKS
ncbi:UNVERIFIED_CONTAM: hypothetical protein HDU68_010001 [Siphonaria sp. JEL0065]|nr:hypothetical protein HDU68_010001 [Siphonaria sp. JEL0065]